MMDRKEKKHLRDEIGKHVNLNNGRFTDSEISRLHTLVQERNSYDGHTKTYRRSYKDYDSEDTYTVQDTDTYTFRSDNDGIRIEHEHTSDWDDGQHNVNHEVANTARGIPRLLGKLKIR